MRVVMNPEDGYRTAMLLLPREDLKAVGLALAINLEHTMYEVQSDLAKSGANSLSLARERWGSTPLLAHHEPRIQAVLAQGKMLRAIVNFWLEPDTDYFNLTLQDLTLLKNPLDRLSGFYLWAGEESFSPGTVIFKLRQILDKQTVPA